MCNLGTRQMSVPIKMYKLYYKTKTQNFNTSWVDNEAFLYNLHLPGD